MTTYNHQTKGMKSLMLATMTLLLLTACSRDAGEVAARAAKLYYDNLLEDKYESFVDGMYQQRAISDSFRNQLILNARMFVEQQQKEHNGIMHIESAGGKADSTGYHADAFLVIHYGDSTAEQIVVPMIRKDKLWLMR